MKPWVCIPLSGKIGKGRFTFVDKRDAALAQSRPWSDVGGYARHRSGALHRLILGAKAGEIVDHINGNKLDNRRSNLRICSHSENTANTNYRNLRSCYRGISPCKGGWRASCQRGNDRLAGVAADETEAARLYDAFATALYGTNARLNFPKRKRPAEPEPAQ